MATSLRTLGDRTQHRARMLTVAMALVLAVLAIGCRETEPERRAARDVEATRAPQPVPTTPTPAATPAATAPAPTRTPRPCSEYSGRVGAYPGVLDPPEPRGGELVTLTLPVIPPGAYNVILFPRVGSGLDGYVLGTMDAANGQGAIRFLMPEVPRGCVPIDAFDTRDYRGSYPVITTNLVDYRGPGLAPAPCSALPDDAPRRPSGYRGEVTSNGSGWIYRLIGAHDVPTVVGGVSLRLRYGGQEAEGMSGVITADATGFSMPLQLPAKPDWSGKCVSALFSFRDGLEGEAFFDYP